MTFPTTAEGNGPMVDLSIIAQIESGGNSRAFNKKSGAAGPFQITQVVVDEYNQNHVEQMTLKDMHDWAMSTQVASWYLKTRDADRARAGCEP
jgi:hypothetical protein